MIASRAKNETSNRYGRLLVLCAHDSKNGVRWKCRCDCGKIAVVKGVALRNGTVKSCGCGSIEQARKNLRKVAVARRSPYPCQRKMKDLYRNMRDRCYNPANKRWNDYGGRGIKVCKLWLTDRQAFYLWCFENGIAAGLQIDRINNNGNYRPSNCRFVDMFVQANNTRKNRPLTWGGKTLTASQWARELGVRQQAFQHRVDRKWALRRIFTQPFRKSRQRA